MRILCHLFGCVPDLDPIAECRRCHTHMYQGPREWLGRPRWLWWLAGLPSRVRKLWPWRECPECGDRFFCWPWESDHDYCSYECLMSDIPF